MLIHYEVLGQSGTPTGDRNEVTRRVLREVGSTINCFSPSIPEFKKSKQEAETIAHVDGGELGCSLGWSRLL
ncbi:MAG: hypothetical protein SVP52_09325 [Chloroflexota bacterium]|nr:hypothetical protein [Chloroflexota bacterium]